ncbi:MAG: hypothetical protein IE913_06890, partial [Halothiobacillus sp.]|nr:hypothetical protein [Halothiobacillus sp.]
MRNPVVTPLPRSHQCLIKRRAPPEIPEAMSGIESRLAEILVTRGIVDPEQINPDLGLLLPPADMPGIELAADILANAVREHARILIVG